MVEEMDCSKLKDKLGLLDKDTKAWIGDDFPRNLQVFIQPTSYSATTWSGPGPMEIDQVQYGNKGKNKGTGKQKGKKGGWFTVEESMEVRKVEEKASQSTKERRAVKVRTKESSRRENAMVVEALAAHAGFAVLTATGEMNVNFVGQVTRSWIGTMALPCTLDRHAGSIQFNSPLQRRRPDQVPKEHRATVKVRLWKGAKRDNRLA
eukprot:s1306_g17.t1